MIICISRVDFTSCHLILGKETSPHPVREVLYYNCCFLAQWTNSVTLWHVKYTHTLCTHLRT